MPKRPITAEDLYKFQNVSDPQIHPDGCCILFAKSQIGKKNKKNSQLFTVDLDGKVRQWTRGESSAGHGRFSPTGDRIAFVAKRGDGPAQIHMLRTDGGEAEAVTSVADGSIGGFTWSPNGRYIAFTFRPTDPERTEARTKEREAEGLSTPPWVLDDLWYRLDGDGYFGGQRYSLWVLDLESGEAKELYTASPNGFYSFAWAPDSTELAVAHAVEKNWMAARDNDQIFRVKLDGSATKLEGLPDGSKGALAWSPDGKTIAYIGNLNADDAWGTQNNDLFVVPATGGTPRNLTENDDYCLSVMTLSDTRDAAGDAVCDWSADSKSITVSVGWHGEVHLGRVDVAKGGVEVLTEGRYCLAIGSATKDGRVACTVTSATTLAEVAILDPGAKKPKILTHFNDDVLAEIQIVEPEEHWLESTDGIKVHTWVMKPAKLTAKSKAPGVLQIHGGPHTQYGWAFFHEFQLLAAQGYVVVYSNPRGSKGYGEAFCAAIRRNWGDKDWADIQTVTRFMQHHPNIHAGCMGVMGGSYGGYMTNWVVGHTDAFKAAITDRCVSNLISMAGSSDFVSNRDDYFGGCAFGGYDRIEDLWRQSPIAYFEGVKTPMLVIHSEGDLRCNIEQGEQVFAALQIQGVPSRFVRYPRSTFHGMSRSGPIDLKIHRLGEILRWWAEHLPPTGR